MATLGASLFLAANHMSLFASFLIMTAATVVDNYLISSLSSGTKVTQARLTICLSRLVRWAVLYPKGMGK